MPVTQILTTKKQMKTIANYINGEFCAPVSGNYIETSNPATGEMYAKLPDSNHRDVQLAVEAAQNAFPEWQNTSAQDRAKLLFQIAQRIEDLLEELALAETNDTGKPLWLSQSVDIPRAASNFRFFASGILHFASESHMMENTAINYTLRQPLGVVGCISPWNLPLYLFSWKIAPALAAGNCVITKPSEITPMTAFLLAQICNDIELPPGVLNIVHGFGRSAGKSIVEHPDVSAISFTGGTKTGREIAQTAAPMFKKLSLEMGGKNPVVIFDDCNYDDMLATTLRSSFTNQGQICLCGSRIYVEHSLYERFRNDFVEYARDLEIGDPLAEGTLQGAVISGDHLQKIKSYVQLAEKEGGEILCGGNAVQLDGRCRNGWFFEPTIIEGLSSDCRVNQEEIFGPVVTIAPFDDEIEALQLANGTPYGLAATIWTEDLTRAHRLSNQLNHGIAWVNCWMLRDLRTPFGGMKQSGMGREGGFEALRFFTEPKNICIKI